MATTTAFLTPMLSTKTVIKKTVRPVSLNTPIKEASIKAKFQNGVEQVETAVSLKGSYWFK